MNQQAKIIQVDRDSEGNVGFIEKEVKQSPVAYSEYEPLVSIREAEVDGRTMHLPLKESFMNNPDAANILRSDIRYIAFTNYDAMPRSFTGFTRFEQSSRPSEQYLRDAAIGVLPKVPSGTETPFVQSNFEGGVEIVNDRYAARIAILGDWIRFDQLGKIRQAATEMGIAARMTEEAAVYNYITATGNYSRNSTTNDNDVGANTQSLTFNGVNLETAMSIISTSKDRKSGAYLGCKADTIIVGPRMEVPVKQLLLSGDLNRVGGNTTNEVRGQGTLNMYRGMVDNIIISPWFNASYQWALCDSAKNSFIFQTVEPFNVYQQQLNISSQSWLERDTVEYLVQGYFGVGFVDDRAWFFSSSTTAPTVG